MAGAVDSILDLVGNTPLVRLNKLPQSLGIKATVFAKLEYYNPGGSVKDRIAYRMVIEAERNGRIRPGDTLIEPTSGNTGIGLALVACVRGYKAIITMPEKMSAEKVAVLRTLNATIIRTPTEAAYDSPESHIGVAKRLQKEIPNAHILDQYGNVENPKAHEYGTAAEIFRQTGGEVDAVVAGAGTGGTITGVARGLRLHKPGIQIIAADPKGSILAQPSHLNDEHANQPYKVEGIGYDFVPDVLERTMVDRWYKTDDREAFAYASKLHSMEALLVGGSSGSVFSAFVQAMKDRQIKEHSTVVLICADGIRNYFSTFVDPAWLSAHGLLPQLTAREVSAGPEEQIVRQSASFHDATVRSLNLKKVETVTSSSRCRGAVKIMHEQGFDQLPVIDSSSGRLVGLVTLGNVLSRINHGRATLDDGVPKVMFGFAGIDQVRALPHDQPPHRHITSSKRNPTQNGCMYRLTRRKFVEITMDTSLALLNQFFEWNSAAIITERDEKEAVRPVAVATKVDLLTWMLREQG